MGVSDNPSHGDGAVPNDAHGQAALLLVESLIHALVEKRLLSLAEAIEVIDVAAEVEGELSATTGGLAPSLLAPLAHSLRLDLS